MGQAITKVSASARLTPNSIDSGPKILTFNIARKRAGRGLINIQRIKCSLLIFSGTSLYPSSCPRAEKLCLFSPPTFRSPQAIVFRQKWKRGEKASLMTKSPFPRTLHPLYFFYANSFIPLPHFYSAREAGFQGCS